uniref:Uncharacterized protein n=1 Tax=Timema genevievae TaxID=629358 RepID=A0A7R9JV12_TIMGE|nr:unnamed protein product [Timema genevievae]
MTGGATTTGARSLNLTHSADRYRKYATGLPRLYRRSISIYLELNATNTMRRMPTARPCFGSSAPRRARAVRFGQIHLANGHVTRSRTATKRDYANCPELSQNTRRTISGWKPSQRLPVRRFIARFETDFQSATNKFLDKF